MRDASSRVNMLQKYDTNTSYAYIQAGLMTEYVLASSKSVHVGHETCR